MKQLINPLISGLSQADSKNTTPSNSDGGGDCNQINIEWKFANTRGMNNTDTPTYGSIIFPLINGNIDSKHIYRVVEVQKERGVYSMDIEDDYASMHTDWEIPFVEVVTLTDDYLKLHKSSIIRMATKVDFKLDVSELE